MTRPEGSISLTYDAAGRLSTLTSTGLAREFGYDATSGSLVSITSSGASLAYTYDGPLMKNVTWSGGVSGSIAFTYDTDFRLNGETIGAAAVAYGYDSDSLLTSAGALTLTRRAADGLLSGTTLGGVADSWTYDDFGDPLTYAATYGGTTLFAESFTRDSAGRITDKAETLFGTTSTEHYEYDTAGRLEGTRGGHVFDRRFRIRCMRCYESRRDPKSPGMVVTILDIA